MNNRASPSPRQLFSLRVTGLAIILVGAALLSFAMMAYPEARQIADRLAPDGSFDAFSLESYQSLKSILTVLASAVIAGGVLALSAPKNAFTVLAFLWRETFAAVSGWPRDVAAVFRDLRIRLLRRELLLPLIAITLLAFLARILYINDPFGHDEAYSFTVFVKLPLPLAVSDYHFPNNHLFHTLLSVIANRLFGDQPWVVRLPAFSAGIALVPAGVLLARQMYGKSTSLLAGAALAVSPSLIHYSTNARGYSLLALFTLLLLILAVELPRRSNLFLWSLAALVSALGFYTLPVFLLPFGVVVTWLALSGLDRRVIPAALQVSWFYRLGLFILTTGLLTLLFYLPVFRYSGVASVVANPYVQPLSWQDLWPTLVSRFKETAEAWTTKVPQFAVWLALAGLALSLVLHRRISRQPIPTQLAALIFIPIIVVGQRLNAWPKIWQFLLPLLIIWASSGLVGGLDWVQRKFRSRIRLADAGVYLAIAGLAALGAVNAFRDHPGLRPAIGSVEHAAIYLDEHLADQNIVVIAPVDDAPLWYYFYKYDLSQEYFRHDVPFRKAYVLVSRDQGQTLADVLAVRGPDRGFLDLTTSVLLETWNELDLYSIDANWQAVSKAYQIGIP